MQERIHAAALASDTVLWTLSPEGALTCPSPSWSRFTGQPAEASLGHGWLDAVHEEDRSRVIAAYGPGEPSVREVECRLRRVNGRYTRVRMRLVPVVIDGLREWVGSCSEVWADESVRRSEERLRLATEAAQVAIWEYDFVAGQMTRTENHDALYGLPPQAVWQYDLFTQATHPDDRAMADRTVQASVAPGGPDHYAFDFRVIWPDGSIHWLAVSGQVVLRDAEGRGLLVRGALIDVTRLKDTEAKLTEAVRMREEFLQVASHELNTPLTPLSLKLETLLRAARAGTLRGESAIVALDNAHRQVRRLAAMVRDLLDVTRLSKGRLELSLGPVSLAEVVRSAAEQISTLQDGADPLVRSLGPDLVGTWDRERLEQAVVNLLSNAIKYGEGRPVRVELGQEHDHALLRVIDQGVGIAPELLPRIFEKFERAPSARYVRGLGLGLFIARQVALSHGGDIHVASVPGQGSTFTLRLPLAGPTTAN